MTVKRLKSYLTELLFMEICRLDFSLLLICISLKMILKEKMHFKSGLKKIIVHALNG